MVISGHSSYVSFFREACEKHVDILHAADNKHFARIVLTYDPILGAAAQIREFISGKKFELKEPIMLLASYVASYSDDHSDNVVKQLSGALIILKKAKQGDFDAEEVILEIVISWQL